MLGKIPGHVFTGKAADLIRDSKKPHKYTETSSPAPAGIAPDDDADQKTKRGRIKSKKIWEDINTCSGALVISARNHFCCSRINFVYQVKNNE